MPPSNEADAPPAAWATWLHALWGGRAGVAWQVAGAGPAEGRPVLTGRSAGDCTLHLPAGSGRRVAWAAAAHAAAHWRFGGEEQARAGLKPVQQALFGVLEDARVEWLALQELPGLRALWLPFHAGEDAPAGNGFEALLARLARSLLEREPADPHPWVMRARSEFLARDGEALAVRTTAEARALASRLGNDIGQMRLPFNPRTYRVHAAYRDDGAWLWTPEAAAPASETALAARSDADGNAGTREAVRLDVGTPVTYPEWDARIGRYRAGWCSVYTCDAPLAPPLRALHVSAARSRRLVHALTQERSGPPRAAGLAAVGEEFHPMALLDARLQRIAGRTPDERVYRRLVPPPRRFAVQVLLDASQSSADPGPDGRPWLDAMLETALDCAAALDAAGHRVALASFASRTRHRIEVRPLKEWHECAAEPAVLARCRAQRSGGSTRTGAALRHATREALDAAAGRGLQPLVLLVTDGELHDVDAPDPAYLAGDLRRAMGEARRQGVSVRCLRVASPRMSLLPA